MYNKIYKDIYFLEVLALTGYLVGQMKKLRNLKANTFEFSRDLELNYPVSASIMTLITVKWG